MDDCFRMQHDMKLGVKERFYALPFLLWPISRLAIFTELAMDSDAWWLFSRICRTGFAFSEPLVTYIYNRERVGSPCPCKNRYTFAAR